MEERLRKFATLVEEGSFTRAAARMHTSQPALTVAISKLERELGTQLLVRGPRSFELTPAGEVAYRSAKELTVTTSNLQTQLRALAGQQPRVTIGLIDSLASMLFKAPVGSAENPFSDLSNMSVIVNNSGYLLRAVSHGDIDIAFITEQPTKSSELVSVESVGVEPMALVCRADLRQDIEQQLNHRRAVQFVSYDQPSTTYQIIRSALTKQGITIKPIFYSSSPEIMLELVLRGTGVSVLPYFLVKEQLAGRRLAIIRHPERILVERPISCIVQSRKRLTMALVDLPQIVESMLQSEMMLARR